MKTKTHTIVVEMQVEAISRKDAADKIHRWFKARSNEGLLLGYCDTHGRSKREIIEDGYF